MGTAGSVTRQEVYHKTKKKKKLSRAEEVVIILWTRLP